MIPRVRWTWGRFIALSILLGPQVLAAQDQVQCTSVGPPAELGQPCTYFVRADFVPSEGVQRDGRTPETAFSSIRQAAAQLGDLHANPGEVVCVGPGTYEDGDIAPGRSGIEGAPIQFFADRTGTQTGDPAGAVHVLPGTSGRFTGFLLIGRKHIVIDGFTITGFLDQGINVRSGGTGIIIRNVAIQDCGRSGIDIDAAGTVIVEASCTLRNGTTGLSLQSKAFSGEPIVPTVSNTQSGMNGVHGIFVQAASGGLIEDSVLFENGNTGIRYHSIAEGGVTLRNVDVRGSGRGGVEINAEGLVVVESVSSIGNGANGISLQGDSLSGTPIIPFVSNTRSGLNAVHGILVQTASSGLLQNNVVYSNEATGITLRAAPDMQTVNNLVYANREEGLGVGSNSQPSPFALVVNNTFFANGDWGVEIGGGSGSPGATLLNNILLANGQPNGVGVLNERSQGLRIPTTCGYTAGFNVNADGYGPSTPHNVYDILSDPLFVDPAGPDGVVGAERVDGKLVDRSADDNFRLRQGSGATEISPAVNAGHAPVGTVGLTGSTSDDGRLDTGIIDIGYHYDALSTQVLNVTRPFMPIYVRKIGDDRAGGKSPSQALATIAVAGELARAGVTVVVGPGRYAECDLGPPTDAGLATFLADASGQRTGDPPGPVLVDARSENCPLSPGVGEDGFLLSRACFATVDGFHIRNALDDGIKVINQSDGAVIRNNVSFSNLRGIQVVNSNDVRIVNNLTYANDGGIQTGGTCSRDDCSQAGSRKTWIQNNTSYGNEFNGILIGAGQGVSDEVSVLYNIMQENGANGIQIGSGGTLDGYDASFNINAEGRYAAPKPESDLITDPLLVSPAGLDGILGGLGFEDDDFHLEQLGSGQSRTSPGVNWGMSRTAEEAGVADRSTRTDRGLDVGFVDLGFHYSGSIVLPGDCNENDEVTVDELVLGLDIALDRAPLSACPALDRNRDGSVGIDDLVAAIDVALAGSF